MPRLDSRADFETVKNEYDKRKVNPADFYSQANLPIVGLVVEHLLEALIFKMLEILFAQRSEDKFCSWAGEDAQAVSSALHNIVTKKNRHLYAIGP